MDELEEFKTYNIVIPLSLFGILIAFVIACGILILVGCMRRLHTVTHLLICNTSISSIFYCVVQSVNYIFLLCIKWEINDVSCRWRGYFGYMAVVAVVYSYLTQAISRFFISILSTRYPRITSFRTHFILILLQWFVVILIPLPAILTNHIRHRPFSLCWVPKKFTSHVIYTIVAYYLIPALLIFAIHMYIYVCIKYPRCRVFILTRRHRAKRDLQVLYNIMILFAIYTLGAIPIVLYILTNVRFLYGMGIISMSFTVAIEKIVTIILDRDIRNIIKLYFRRSMVQVTPIY
ncbi:unnamed protein product [Rotaria socialis]|uniref:G-protein coupled receptors family 1 profile domain-containing protein n=1 Tax=Rotaria socialis TaxID=392032 RepID=A0A821GCB8_9BILA|nr:unnamed protein product [Rotaria socialis]CAF3289713.1 unnamed protein product [Rotaria socialis]CAF3387623.1 unnamed protein product [Rotaria socialis]CAF4115777.1 unnamed protein product [Rotaria socialis]CAF4471735.1 unnamed protein product [Rotaria socialis]